MNQEDKPIIVLNGWQTITHYAKEQNISTQLVNNWIRRNKIKAIRYDELNGLVLVKKLDDEQKDHNN